MLAKLKKLFSGKYSIFEIMRYLGVTNYLSDEKFLKTVYKDRLGKELNLDTPQNFNEKLQWLKLYDRKPEYTIYVDKIEVRKYIAKTIGEEYLIPCLGVWDSPYDIDFSSLPNQFVLKCNHNSGLGMCICKDKSKLNINKVKKELSKGLKQNYFIKTREWPYKNVKPRIIAEKYMVDESGNDLKDYKWFCFNGIPKILLIARDRSKKAKTDFFDMEFNRLNLQICNPVSKVDVKKPKSMDKMKELAEILSRKIPHLRVDFYEINGKIYFGELTFFHCSGLEKINPKEWDYKMGSWIEL